MSELCEAQSGRYKCIWLAGHKGPHRSIVQVPTITGGSRPQDVTWVDPEKKEA